MKTMSFHSITLLVLSAAVWAGCDSGRLADDEKQEPITMNAIYTETVSIGAGQELILSDATINVSSGPAILCEGDATITLLGNNTVFTSEHSFPAIKVGGADNTLIIQGSGSLTATGGHASAGIGSESGGTCGNITICGGTVTAQGGDDAAGIGSGYRGKCGNISISGGIVTATGGNSAAGIGSGHYGLFSSITIGSGITLVKAIMGSEAQAPIGKGEEDSGSGVVTIDGTTAWTPGTATTNLDFQVSFSINTDDTWTLTPKQAL